MANPTKLTWSLSNTYIDGSPFGQADFAGFEIVVDSATTSVAIPVSWNSSGNYEFPLSSLDLKYGTHTLVMFTVAKNGQKSNPSNTVTFTIQDLRVPKPPFGLTAV